MTRSIPQSRPFPMPQDDAARIGDYVAPISLIVRIALTNVYEI